MYSLEEYRKRANLARHILVYYFASCCEFYQSFGFYRRRYNLHKLQHLGLYIALALMTLLYSFTPCKTFFIYLNTRR